MEEDAVAGSSITAKDCDFMGVLLADELIAESVPNPHRQHSIPGGLVQNKKFNKKAPPVEFQARLLAKERENRGLRDWVRELHATLLKDQ
jgi:hypothetical protein